MSGGPKGAKRPLERPLDERVRRVVDDLPALPVVPASTGATATDDPAACNALGIHCIIERRLTRIAVSDAMPPSGDSGPRARIIHSQVEKELLSAA